MRGVRIMSMPLRMASQNIVNAAPIMIGLGIPAGEKKHLAPAPWARMTLWMASIMLASFGADVAKPGEPAHENGQDPEHPQRTTHADKQHGRTKCRVVHQVPVFGMLDRPTAGTRMFPRSEKLNLTGCYSIVKPPF